MMRIAPLIVLGGAMLLAGIVQVTTGETPPVVSETKKQTPLKEPATAEKTEKEQPAAQNEKSATAEQGKGEVLLAAPPPPKTPVPIKTRMIRALLDALEGIQGLEPEQKEGVVQSLMAADEELSRVLGGNSKRLILRANRKPPLLIVGEPHRSPILVPDQPLPPPGAEPVPPSVSPPDNSGTAQRPSPASPQVRKKAIIQTLLKTLDEMPGESPQAKEEVRKMLLEADKKLEKTPAVVP